VHITRPGGAARLFSYVLFAWLAVCGAALADVTVIQGADAPIVRIQIPAQANLTVRTWDRNAVQIEADPGVYTVERAVNRVPAILLPQLIRLGQTKGPDGEIVLPAESFVISTLPAGPREVVIVKGEAGHPVGPITVTVPSNSVLVNANVARGSVLLQNYQNGTFIVHLNVGAVVLDGVGGDGFVQVLHGPLVADESNFNRLRARTAVGNQIFEHCNARQIEASVANGSIVYDNGHFDAGLARFDVTNGNVAVGTSGASQLNGRVVGGHVYTLFERRVQVDARDTEATALVEGGGPVVTATTANGNVYLYDGTLRVRARLPTEWRAAQAALRRENFGVAPRNPQPSVAQPPAEPPKNRPGPRPPPRGGRLPSGGHRLFFLRHRS
jgi:hypothetical protein